MLEMAYSVAMDLLPKNKNVPITVGLVLAAEEMVSVYQDRMRVKQA